MLAFLDIETTGLDPYRHEILEVAFILMPMKFEAPVYDEVHFSLDVDLSLADPDALEVNKYSDRRAELQRIREPRDWAAATLAHRLKDVTIVGNNPSFDLSFISYFLREENKPTHPWHYQTIDLKSMVAGRCHMPLPASTRLIAEISGVPVPSNAHSALADAYWNLDVYTALTSR